MKMQILDAAYRLHTRGMKWAASVLALLLLSGCAALTVMPQATGMTTETPQAATENPLGISAPQPLVTPTKHVIPTTEAPAPTAAVTASPTPPSATSTPVEEQVSVDSLQAPVRFAVIGDYGDAQNPGMAAVAALVDSWSPEFIITTGDNNYPAGEGSTIDENIGLHYHEYIYNYQGEYGAGSDVNRFFPSMGNHDWMTRSGGPYLDFFTLPGNERYYNFTWGVVDFFVLSSDSREPDGVGRSSQQAKWFSAAIQQAAAPWQIVVFHHAPYTSGSFHGPTNWAQWPYASLGADAVLTGHEHVYERLQVDGIPYFVNGLGGGAIYGFDDPSPNSMARYNSGYGAMLVEADETRIFFQFINTNGEVVDSFEVRK